MVWYIGNFYFANNHFHKIEFDKYTQSVRKRYRDFEVIDAREEYLNTQSVRKRYRLRVCERGKQTGILLFRHSRVIGNPKRIEQMSK
jgi:hypothetical protein